MEKELSQAELSDLQTALNQLHSFALPAEIKNVLDDAIRSLVVLSSFLLVYHAICPRLVFEMQINPSVTPVYEEYHLELMIFDNERKWDNQVL